MAAPAPPRTLPALSEHRWLRFGVFTAFYLVQGLPIGVMQTAFPAWYLAHGMDAARVGTFSAIASLPWAFKLIAGPFMDRFAFPPMGVRRPWVIGAQLLLALSGVALWFLHDPIAQFWPVLIVITVMNSLAAIQDVGVDGMAITVLREDERARANAFMIGGQVAGSSLTGWLAVVLLNAYGVAAVGVMMTAAVATAGSLAVLFRERPGERIFPWSSGSAHPEAPRRVKDTPQLVAHVVRLLVLPMSLVLMAVELSYRVLEGVAAVWWPDVAINALQFTDEQYGRWNLWTSNAAVVVGIPLGMWIEKIGGRRGVGIGLASNALLYVVLWSSLARLANPAIAIAALLVAQIGTQWMFISTVSLFMSLCGVRVAATQFAVYMALSNLARSGGAKLYAYLPQWFTAEGVYLFMAVGYLLAMSVLAFFQLPRHRQRLAELGET